MIGRPRRRPGTFCFSERATRRSRRSGLLADHLRQGREHSVDGLLEERAGLDQGTPAHHSRRPRLRTLRAFCGDPQTDPACRARGHPEREPLRLVISERGEGSSRSSSTSWSNLTSELPSRTARAWLSPWRDEVTRWGACKRRAPTAPPGRVRMASPPLRGCRRGGLRQPARRPDVGHHANLAPFEPGRARAAKCGTRWSSLSGLSQDQDCARFRPSRHPPDSNLEVQRSCSRHVKICHFFAKQSVLSSLSSRTWAPPLAETLLRYAHEGSLSEGQLSLEREVRSRTRGLRGESSRASSCSTRRPRSSRVYDKKG